MPEVYVKGAEELKKNEDFIVELSESRDTHKQAEADDAKLVKDSTESVEKFRFDAIKRLKVFLSKRKNILYIRALVSIIVTLGIAFIPAFREILQHEIHLIPVFTFFLILNPVSDATVGFETDGCLRLLLALPAGLLYGAIVISISGSSILAVLILYLIYAAVGLTYTTKYKSFGVSVYVSIIVLLTIIPQGFIILNYDETYRNQNERWNRIAVLMEQISIAFIVPIAIHWLLAILLRPYFSKKDAVSEIEQILEQCADIIGDLSSCFGECVVDTTGQALLENKLTQEYFEKLSESMDSLQDKTVKCDHSIEGAVAELKWSFSGKGSDLTEAFHSVSKISKLVTFMAMDFMLLKVSHVTVSETDEVYKDKSSDEPDKPSDEPDGMNIRTPEISKASSDVTDASVLSKNELESMLLNTQECMKSLSAELCAVLKYISSTFSCPDASVKEQCKDIEMRMDNMHEISNQLEKLSLLWINRVGFPRATQFRADLLPIDNGSEYPYGVNPRFITHVILLRHLSKYVKMNFSKLTIGCSTSARGYSLKDFRMKNGYINSPTRTFARRNLTRTQRIFRLVSGFFESEHFKTGIKAAIGSCAILVIAIYPTTYLAFTSASVGSAITSYLSTLRQNYMGLVTFRAFCRFCGVLLGYIIAIAFWHIAYDALNGWALYILGLPIGLFYILAWINWPKYGYVWYKSCSLYFIIVLAQLQTTGDSNIVVTGGYTVALTLVGVLLGFVMGSMVFPVTGNSAMRKLLSDVFVHLSFYIEYVCMIRLKDEDADQGTLAQIYQAEEYIYRALYFDVAPLLKAMQHEVVKFRYSVDSSEYKKALKQTRNLFYLYWRLNRIRGWKSNIYRTVSIDYSSERLLLELRRQHQPCLLLLSSSLTTGIPLPAVRPLIASPLLTYSHIHTVDKVLKRDEGIKQHLEISDSLRKSIGLNCFMEANCAASHIYEELFSFVNKHTEQVKYHDELQSRDLEDQTNLFLHTYSGSKKLQLICD